MSQIEPKSKRLEVGSESISGCSWTSTSHRLPRQTQQWESTNQEIPGADQWGQGGALVSGRGMGDTRTSPETLRNYPSLSSWKNFSIPSRFFDVSWWGLETWKNPCVSSSHLGASWKGPSVSCGVLLTLLVIYTSLGITHAKDVAAAYDPEASITGLYTGPYFDPLTPHNLTAHLEDEAKLPCTVRQLGDKSVSWVRVRDADILTVDRYTFVGDERFESHYTESTETWNLVIKYVQERDAGEYECQISTEPKMSQLFSLRVVIPKVSIVPVGDRYVKAGSTVRVDCQITDVVQLPDYIFWYHGSKRLLDRRDPNLLVTVKQTDIEAITSTLTIHKVKQQQRGNYTCMPSNLHAASVTLHVLNEKHPAAMQGERNRCCSHEAPLPLLTLALLVCVLTWSFASMVGSDGDNSKDQSMADDSITSQASSSSSFSSHILLCLVVPKPSLPLSLLPSSVTPSPQPLSSSSSSSGKYSKSYGSLKKLMLSIWARKGHRQDKDHMTRACPSVSGPTWES